MNAPRSGEDVARNPWHVRYLASMWLATGGVLALWFGWLAVAVFSVGMVVMTLLAVRWGRVHSGRDRA